MVTATVTKYFQGVLSFYEQVIWRLFVERLFGLVAEYQKVAAKTLGIYPTFVAG